MEDLLAKVQEWFALYGLKVLGAVVIIVVGRWVAKMLERVVARVMTRAKFEATLVSFLSHLTYVTLILFVVIAALKQVGFETTSFIAVVGAAGLAVGLALQGSLANFASGVLLTIFRPLKVGDFVEVAGVQGTVEDVDIFTTTVVTPDNRTVIVPNAKLTGDNIINFTVKGTRRVDLVIGVSYEADLKKTREVIRSVLDNDDRILNDPAPTIAVLELASSSVDFAVRPWTDAANYWHVYFDTTEAIKERLDSEGISIPYPQRDVHIYTENEAST